MSNKRRRIADEASTQPAVVPSSADTGTGETQVELVSPAYWRQIPELIFVKMQKDNVEEVAEAMGDLRGLMAADNENNDKNTKEASLLGAQSFVIVTMRKFQYDEDVQKYGCGCLQNLAFGVITRRTTIVKAGGMEAVMNALKIFPDSEALACFGIEMLVNIFSDLQPAIIQEASNHFVNNLDGLALAIATMKKFPDNAELQGSCCGLVSLLGPRPQQKKPPPSKPKLPIHKPTPAAATATKTPPTPRNPPSRTNSNQSQLTWDEHFAKLVAYEVENGHPNPPQTKGPDLGNYKLAIWLNSQRRQFRKGTLNSYKTKMLSEMGCEGFILKNPEVASNKDHPEPSPSKRKKVSWNHRYQELKDFKARVGHANPHYGKGTAQCCHHLAQWLSNQRSHFRLGKKISSEQVQWLRELGCRGFEVETAAAAATPSPNNFAQL